MMMIMTLEVSLRQLFARTPTCIRRLVVVMMMIAGVAIERVDHVCQPIPVRLLLDNLPLIRDQILLQTLDHPLGMLDLLGRGSLELLKVLLIVLYVVKHEEVILLEGLQDLQEVLLGEGQWLLGLMCETVLV